MPAADVRHCGSGFELGHDALERRQPAGDQMGSVAGPEEALRSREQTGMMVAPGEGAVTAHGGDELVLVQEQAPQDHRSTGHVDGRVLVRQRHGLLRRQTKPAVDGLDVPSRRLGAEPLPDQPRVTPRPPRKLLGRGGNTIGQRAVQPQLLADDDGRDHCRSTHVGHQFAHEGVQLCLVHRLSSPLDARLGLSRAQTAQRLERQLDGAHAN